MLVLTGPGLLWSRYGGRANTCYYLSKGRRAVERADHLFPAFDEDQVCCRAATVLPGGSVGEGLISHENRAPKSLLFKAAEFAGRDTRGRVGLLALQWT